MYFKLIDRVLSFDPEIACSFSKATKVSDF